MAPPLRVRPYKDFLTPLLHRRFAMATSVLGLLCYAEAVIIGEWNSLFWSWFPLGRAGIRTGLLFIPAFMIFILRVGQLHVGLRTSNSGWHTFATFPKFTVVHTLGWYLLSAWFFSEVYIWSSPKSADLNRIKLMPKTERPMLNEKPIYITSYLLFLAVVQASFHLYFDYDSINTHTVKAQPQASSEQNSHIIEPPFVQIKSDFYSSAVSSLKRVTTLTLFGPFIYSASLGGVSVRTIAWGFTRSWAKIFWSLPKTNSPPSIRPFHISVLQKSAFSGMCLLLLWEIGNAAFSAYVAQEPLKNDRPITYESRDPNGSLLTGLKGKKLQTRAFAFWELVYISQRFQGRRKIIFEDIDRQGGSMWAQILAACLDTIIGIDKRIDEYERPAAAPQTNPSEPKADAIPSLPRLTPPMKDGLQTPGDLFASSTSGTIEKVGKFAKAHGQSPKNIAPRANQLITQAEGALLTPEQKQAVSSEGFVGLFKEWVTLFLQHEVGKPFRQIYRRKVVAIVLGQPFGDVGVIVDAIDSLTRLAVCSLTEDKYGNVQRDVKLIIQTFTNTVRKLEGFGNRVGFHWTDIEKKKESPEVDTILTALKGGLNELVEAFGDYSDDLRLSQSEMRMAREAAARSDAPTEMTQKSK